MFAILLLCLTVVAMLCNYMGTITACLGIVAVLSAVFCSDKVVNFFGFLFLTCACAHLLDCSVERIMMGDWPIGLLLLVSLLFVGSAAYDFRPWKIED